MKYQAEFRDRQLAEQLSLQIKKAITRPWKIMEVCGGQTHTILQFGLEDLLPSELELLHGPGCPVCVTPVSLIDKAIEIAKTADVIFTSYGDMLRVPGSSCDLLQARALGADVRIVYSPLDAVELAKKYPSKRIVFFAVGFETTAPANAMSVHLADKLGLTNYFVLCSHVTVPPVMSSLLEQPDNIVQAFLGPGHVCSIMGVEEYREICQRYKVPIVISGFEPIDILEAILMALLQLERGECRLENQYARAVVTAGNLHAQQVMSEVFSLSERIWRGLGPIPESGYRLAEKYREFDAQNEFPEVISERAESCICISGEILRGLKKPPQCPAFAKECTPETPLGATMVSSEGTCANYYKFKNTQIN
ncbi:MAG: hydrogenase formation protein HypD [Candidatus Obscuribacterales bacterium]|jgi:hydrogenase expression/formation protein HypD|nr:hydrogenase formation protein HypD [Candidatus Obscuribacterales bacterium]